MQASVVIGILAAALAVVAILAAALSVKQVPEGFEYTVERLGRYNRTLSPGLHLVLPFLERIGAELNTREQVLELPAQEAATRDNALVGVTGIVFFQILDARTAAYAVGGLEVGILHLALANIRNLVGSMDLEELLSRRDDIEPRTRALLAEAAAGWGVAITRIAIKDLAPPRDLLEAMVRQTKAERFKRASVVKAEARRQAAMLAAQGTKQAAILEAEGERESAFRRAEAHERLAAAEAEAIALVSAAIAEGEMAAVNYFVAQKYTDALRAIGSAENQKVVLLPLEAASLIGSLAGIAEITGAIGGREPKPRAPSAARRPAQGTAATTRSGTEDPPGHAPGEPAEHSPSESERPSSDHFAAQHVATEPVSIEPSPAERSPIANPPIADPPIADPPISNPGAEAPPDEPEPAHNAQA